MPIRIYLTSLFADDQDRAPRFYTDMLGFEPRQGQVRLVRCFHLIPSRYPGPQSMNNC